VSLRTNVVPQGLYDLRSTTVYNLFAISGMVGIVMSLGKRSRVTKYRNSILVTQLTLGREPVCR
jgi:hypothetical protein